MMILNVLDNVQGFFTAAATGPVGAGNKIRL